eukprot:scaffold137334_cov51-Attheya_sp.AAC.6
MKQGKFRSEAYILHGNLCILLPKSMILHHDHMCADQKMLNVQKFLRQCLPYGITHVDAASRLVLLSISSGGIPNRLNIFTEKWRKYACRPNTVPTMTSNVAYMGVIMTSEQIRKDHGPSLNEPFNPRISDTAGRT